MLLKKLRQSAGLNRNEAYKLLGISKSMICKLEEGKRKPSVNLVQKMSETYRCSVNEIFEALNIKQQNIHKEDK